MEEPAQLTGFPTDGQGLAKASLRLSVHPGSPPVSLGRASSVGPASLLHSPEKPSSQLGLPPPLRTRLLRPVLSGLFFLFHSPVVILGPSVSLAFLNCQ